MSMRDADRIALRALALGPRVIIGGEKAVKPVRAVPVKVIRTLEDMRAAARAAFRK